MRRILILVNVLLLLPYWVVAQAKKDTLRPVEIMASKFSPETISPVAVQYLDKEMLNRLNSVSVADAVKYFSGVVVKDYGGIGGLKTISVRSLGANHTGVVYDGMVMGDAQAGQTDLGRFSLDNIESLQLVAHQPPGLLQPARNFSHATVLMMISRTHSGNPLDELTAKVKGGSFGFFNPSISFIKNCSKSFVVSANMEMQRSDGAYPFADYETGNERKKRINSDIETYRVEADAGYRINDSNRISYKAYFYDAKRGLPGAVVLYNPNSGDRLNNRLFFSQINWQNKLSQHGNLLLSAKYTADNKYYFDPFYPNSSGKLENDFRQKEYYFSSAYSYHFSKFWGFSLSADYLINQLRRKDSFAYAFADPQRNTVLGNIALQFLSKRLQLFGNLLATSSFEKVQNGIAGKSYREATPSLAVNYRLSATSPWRIRGSYKKIFRLPTFDDLYYTNVGNTQLRPEFADLYNLGITGEKQTVGYMKHVSITVDAYYNKVKDKILAIPRQNLFQWSMQNIGKVGIKGTDLGFKAAFGNPVKINWTAQVSYSFQEARDLTDPGAVLYKTQLPYTPKHSGSISLGMVWKRFTAGYNMLLSSFRYRAGEQIPVNLVKEWATQDVNVTYRLPEKKHVNVYFQMEVNNIFNQQYEIIRYYPMPGTNFRLTIAVTKKNI